MGFTIKQARQYAGFTQTEIAERLGISRDVYRRIELNPGSTPVDLAQKFCQVVGIGIDQIFFTKNST